MRRLHTLLLGTLLTLAVNLVPRSASATEPAAATLQVRLSNSSAESVTGRAVIRKNGAVVATVGAGVATILPAGTYQVEVTPAVGAPVQGTRVYSVTLSAGQRRALYARF